MHTNYDVRGMAALACERLGMPDSLVLEVTRVSEDGTEEGIGRIADLDPVTLCSLCERSIHADLEDLLVACFFEDLRKPCGTVRK